MVNVSVYAYKMLLYMYLCVSSVCICFESIVCIYFIRYFISYVFVLYLSYVFVLTVLDLCCRVGFSLAVVSRGSSLVAVLGILIAVASLVAGHGRQDTRASVVVAPRLWNTGSWA